MSRGPSSLTRAFLLAERRLRQNVPCRWPVLIHLRRGMRGSGEFGCAYPALISRKKKHCIVIEIEESLTGQEAIDTLIHEYAHAVAWNRRGSDHGPAWGEAYSRCYRAVVDGGKRRR